LAFLLKLRIELFLRIVNLTSASR